MSTDEHEYKDDADTALDQQNLEAVVANTDQEYDVDQAIRHNQYIGWIMGRAGLMSVGIVYKEGNLVELKDMPGVYLVIPYPPRDWKP